MFEGKDVERQKIEKDCTLDRTRIVNMKELTPFVVITQELTLPSLLIEKISSHYIDSWPDNFGQQTELVG